MNELLISGALIAGYLIYKSEPQIMEQITIPPSEEPLLISEAALSMDIEGGNLLPTKLEKDAVIRALGSAETPIMDLRPTAGYLSANSTFNEMVAKADNPVYNGAYVYIKIGSLTLVTFTSIYLFLRWKYDPYIKMKEFSNMTREQIKKGRKLADNVKKDLSETVTDAPTTQPPFEALIEEGSSINIISKAKIIDFPEQLTEAPIIEEQTTMPINLIRNESESLEDTIVKQRDIETISEINDKIEKIPIIKIDLLEFVDREVTRYNKEGKYNAKDILKKYGLSERYEFQDERAIYQLAQSLSKYLDNFNNGEFYKYIGSLLNLNVQGFSEQKAGIIDYDRKIVNIDIFVLVQVLLRLQYHIQKKMPEDNF